MSQVDWVGLSRGDRFPTRTGTNPAARVRDNRRARESARPLSELSRAASADTQRGASRARCRCGCGAREVVVGSGDSRGTSPDDIPLPGRGAELTGISRNLPSKRDVQRLTWDLRHAMVRGGLGERPLTTAAAAAVAPAVATTDVNNNDAKGRDDANDDDIFLLQLPFPSPAKRGTFAPRARLMSNVPDVLTATGHRAANVPRASLQIRILGGQVYLCLKDMARS